MDIDSMEQAIRTVEETVTKYRDSEFEASFQEMNDLITEVSSMTPLQLPRQRVLGTADIKKHYRIQFLQFIDMISVELKARFSVEGKSVDLGKYRELCTVFKEGEFPKSLRDYKELDYMKLKAEATRFREVTGVSSLHEAKLAYPLPWNERHGTCLLPSSIRVHEDTACLSRIFQYSREVILGAATS